MIYSMKQGEEQSVSLSTVWQSIAGRFDGQMSEISEDGCFIGSAGQEMLGEAISLNVHLPLGVWVTLHGVVISKQFPKGFRLRFTDLTAKNRKLITQVVAAHGDRQAQQTVTEDEKNNPAQIPQGSRRVLIADDEPMTLRMLTVIVEELGYTVVTAADGREAVAILEKDADFAAAMFDMNMPFLFGVDLISYMKTDDRLRRIPVGMVTSEQDPKVWNESFAAGAKMFLSKPFTPAQISMMLRLLTSKN